MRWGHRYWRNYEHPVDALFIAKMGMGAEGAALGTVLHMSLGSMRLRFFYSGSSPLRIRLRFLVRLKMKVIRKSVPSAALRSLQSSPSFSI